MSSRSPHRSASTVVVAALVLASIPLAAVSADNGPGADDNLVVVAHPRQAVVQNGGVVMSSVGGQFVFDFALFDGAGAPFPVTEYVADLTSLHGGGSNPDAPVPADLVFTTDVVLDAASSTGTVRVPAAVLAFNGPFDGVTFTVNVVKDAAGAYLCTDGLCPSGQFSLAANEAAAQGKWDAANQADEAFTPIVTVDGEPSGLVQAGNPLVNPGFELGHSDGGYESVAQPGNTGAKFAIAPWHLTLNAPNLADGDDTVPASFHHVGYEDGTNGAYVDIEYAEADDGKDLIFGQYFSAPTAQSAWIGTDDVTACFDARIYDAAGIMTQFYLQTNVWAAGESHSTQPGFGGILIPTDATWRHYCMDYGAQLDGKTLNEFFFNLYYGTAYGESGPAHPGAKPHVQLDNVRLLGAVLQNGVSTKTDLSDGYSVFILPAGATTLSGGQSAAQTLTTIAGGKTAYVYEIAAMDYTGIAPKAVDVASSPNVVFELLDARDLQTTRASGEGSVWSAAPQDVFRTLAPDGTVSDRLLVVADPADFDTTANLGAGAAPWVFVQQTPDETYHAVYGATSEPSSGYYSPARNAVMGWSLADSMDYAVTPLVLRDAVGASMAAPATLTLACHGQAPNTACYNAASPSAVTLDWAFSTTSRVLETTQVRLVSATNPSLVLGTATATTSGAAASFTLLPSAISNLAATAHNYRVKLVSDAGTFLEAGASTTLDLADLAPTAAFTQSPGSGITRLTTVTLTDASTDSDGSIASRVWTVTHGATLVAQGTGPKLSFTPPYLGDYDVSLLVQDNGGATATATGALTAANVAPHAALAVPAVSPMGPVVFTDASVDPDGVIATREWSQDGGATWTAPAADGTYTVTPAGDGEISVMVRATDADGATDVATATTLVDGAAPETTLTIAPDAPASGWYVGPVSYLVHRSDLGSGVAATLVVIDGQPTEVTGDADITGEVTGDGEHTISVVSVDNAGNLETVVHTATFKIDASAPEAAFTNPQFAGPIGGVFMAGDDVDMTVMATDATSPVVSVVFSVNGSPVYEDTDATDGFGYALDTTGFTPGVYQLQAIATNAAGLSTGTDSVQVLVVPGAPDLG